MRVRRNWRNLLGGVGLLGLLWAVSGAEPARKNYTPVVPASAVHAALRSNLETVRGWLNDKDFASATQAAQGLTALTHLYTYQGSEAAWREKAANLNSICSRLSNAARSKNEAECTKLT